MHEVINYNIRFKSVQNALEKAQIYKFFVQDLQDIRWLTGFDGSVAHMILSQEKFFLLVDERYTSYAQKFVTENSKLKVVQVSSSSLYSTIFDIIDGDLYNISGSNTSIDSLKKMQEARLEVSELDYDPIAELRLVKDGYERQTIFEALQCAETAFKKTKQIELPITEKEFQRKLDSEMLIAGADKPSFETIVASGPNSLQPHSRPTNRTIEEGEFVIVDWGAEIDGYKSDTSRTIWWGEISAEQKRVYDAVKEAHYVAVEFMRPGMTYGEVTDSAVEVFEEHGFGDCFKHPFGHNIGLGIHEHPFFSQSEDTLIQSGHVFAFEPAIYVPGVGGVRLENLYCVAEEETMFLNSLEF